MSVFRVHLIYLIGLVCWYVTVQQVSAISIDSDFSPDNSIIGQAAYDLIGSNGIFALPSGNLVIASPYWGGGRGAVTCLTRSEYSGGNIVISRKNSLTGDSPDDLVGWAVTVLSNGHYVVSSPSWDGASGDNLGAVTWVNGQTCIPYGESNRAVSVSASNSLIGTKKNDAIGYAVTALTNGNYVISSPAWDSPQTVGVGAATWANGATGLIGTITPENSLIGSSKYDYISGQGIVALSNGNYVVLSYLWNRDRLNNIVPRRADEIFWEDSGAATWGNGTTGIVGEVSIANSLVGARDEDYIGERVIALNDGNYVVVSRGWNRLQGAVTWANGTTGLTGEVSEANSVIGTSSGDGFGASPWDNVGYETVVWPDGSYAISDPEWDYNGVIDRGAVRFVEASPHLENLLNNHSFETEFSTSEPDWVGRNLLRWDKRVCDVSSAAVQGACIFQFYTTKPVSHPRKLIQTVEIPDNLSTGDELTLRAQVKAIDWRTGAHLIIRVRYADGTQQNASVAIPAGSYDYTELSTQIMLNQRPQTVSVIVKAGRTHGLLILDELVLQVTDDEARKTPSVRDGAFPLPLPSLPDGFRY